MAKSVTRIFGPFARAENAGPPHSPAEPATVASDAAVVVTTSPGGAAATQSEASAPAEAEAVVAESTAVAEPTVETGTESGSEPPPPETADARVAGGGAAEEARAHASVPGTDTAPPPDVTALLVAPAPLEAGSRRPNRRGGWIRRQRAEAYLAEDGDAESLSYSPVGRGVTSAAQPLASLDGRNISAWFGDHQVLDRVSLTMDAGVVTSLIGPSGCGKSTFLRILNRMHELVPSASLAGEVMLDGEDIYDSSRKLIDARKHIGMVFQKPNPFPAQSIYDNVIAGLKLTGTRASRDEKDELVESCLTKAGLWKEVKDRLRAPGAGLSGGQQQRLCIARALAVKPRVLLMDEPCSALDPTSTRVIEETMLELVNDVTIVIVTHNMQQAQRVSQHCAFFLASHGTPGAIVEHGDTDAMFADPIDPRTFDYVNGRFG